MARRDPAVFKGESLGRPKRWVVVYYPTAGSRRTWRTFRSKEAAEEFRIEALRTARSLDPNAEVDYTISVGDYATGLWMPQIKATVKPSSAQRYEQVLRVHLLPALKDHKVRLLTRGRIKQLLVAKLSEGWSRATVRLMLSTLRLLLTSAVEDNVITHNPAQKLGRQLNLQASPGNVVNAEHQVKAFTPEEMTRFFDAAKQSPIPYGPLLWLMALTGVRLGEGVTIRWSDFDVADRKLHIQRTLSSGLLSTPKSGRDRIVDLSERAATMLHRLQLTRVDRAKRLKWKTMPEYVFATRRGEPPNPHSIRAEFAKVLDRAALPSHHSPHSLRHSFATLLLRNGESLKFVKEQLGHATIALTADLYGQWARSEPVRGGAHYLDSMARPQTVSNPVAKHGLRGLKGPQTEANRAALTGSCSSRCAGRCHSRS